MTLLYQEKVEYLSEAEETDWFEVLLKAVKEQKKILLSVKFFMS